MALSDSAGLLFKIRADGSQAKREIRDVKDEVSSSSSGMASAFSGLAGPAAIAGAAIAGIATAAASVGMTLFNLAQSASEFGSEIFDAGQKTGLSAERLSAFKFAADQSGTSLDAVTGGFARFSKTIGEAANGSDKAHAKMAALGVTSTDLDTALSQALATIVKLEPGTAQMNAAMEAFGRTGADLLPFIRSFDGDMEALTRTAKELGVTIDDETAAAADEFGDTMDTLTAQLRMAGVAFGSELMPIFQRGAEYISDWLSKNKGEIESWGNFTAQVLRGLAEEWTAAEKAAKGYGLAQAAAFALKITLPGLLLEYLRQRGAQAEATTESAGAGLKADPFGGFGGSTGGAPKKPKTNRINVPGQSWDETSRQEEIAVERARSTIAALRLAAQEQIQIAENTHVMLETSEKEHAARMGKIRQDLLRDEKAAIEELLANQNISDKTRIANQERLAEINVELAGARMRTAQEVKEAIDKETEAEEKLLATKQKQREEAQKKADQDYENWLKEQERKEQERIDEEEKWRRGEIEGTFGGGFVGALDEATGRIDSFKDVLGGLGNMAAGVFMQMGAGLGNMLEQWVLLGDQANVSMSKMVAAVLAGTAAQAAQLAIFHLAMGIAALTPWGAIMYGPAPLHFKAAALWGTVAVGAALAGRAIAGNNFQKQTTASTGGSRAAGGSSGGSGGGVYSKYGDDVTVMEAGRNRPENNQTITLRVVSNDSHIVEVLEKDVRGNGRTRGLIIDTAAAG